MNKKKSISGVGIVGSIINIIFGLAGIILSIIILFVYLDNTRIVYSYLYDYLEIMITSSILALFTLICLVSIIKNAQLISGNLQKKVSAVIFGFFSLSLLGSIFIMFSKVVVTIEKVKIKIVNNVEDYNEMIKALHNYKSLLDLDVITEDEYKIIKGKLFELY